MEVDTHHTLGDGGLVVFGSSGVVVMMLFFYLHIHIIACIYKL